MPGTPKTPQEQTCGDEDCRPSREQPQVLPNGMLRVITARLNPNPDLHLNVGRK